MQTAHAMSLMHPILPTLIHRPLGTKSFPDSVESMHHVPFPSLLYCMTGSEPKCETVPVYPMGRTCGARLFLRQFHIVIVIAHRIAPE